ncbi:hypothetical protein J2R99_002179 [Rhodopseudomonas julia]|uniref:Uncharacterized protein n=1 Tax=Rhodopseudomonas julia TaxID=200617 RepID=A0ABU0C711_9BRAD|nr:hypothetical protein [Rhodopseudomonas julia]MDQ0326310.1 hypothetical protein [Rhodopseudomonas julia]
MTIIATGRRLRFTFTMTCFVSSMRIARRVFIGAAFGLVAGVLAALVVVDAVSAVASLRLDAFLSVRILRAMIAPASLRLMSARIASVGVGRFARRIMLGRVQMSAIIRR